MSYFDHKNKVENVVYLTIEQIITRWEQGISELKRKEEEQNAAIASYREASRPAFEQLSAFEKLLEDSSFLSNLDAALHGERLYRIGYNSIHVSLRFKKKLTKLSDFPLLTSREIDGEIKVEPILGKEPRYNFFSNLIRDLEDDIKTLKHLVTSRGLRTSSEFPVEVSYLERHELLLPTDESVLIRI